MFFYTTNEEKAEGGKEEAGRCAAVTGSSFRLHKEPVRLLRNALFTRSYITLRK
jgi:hypothetical protein